MPNIRPVSDLRNYSDVLQEVKEGAPVFLTKNGRGRYAVLDIEDFEKAEAARHLAAELERGRRSGELGGWLSAEEMAERLAAKANES